MAKINGNIYTKKMLCEDLQKEFGGAFIKQESIVDFVFDTLTEKIKENKAVSIAKFGIFRRKMLAKCVRHNPKNMQKVTKEAHGRVSFRPATALKEILW